MGCSLWNSFSLRIRRADSWRYLEWGIRLRSKSLMRQMAPWSEER